MTINTTQIVRTDDARFQGLPDYAFQPQYMDITDADSGEKLRLHYLDEGDKSAPIILLLHGEPSWCYLYRKMIPPLVAAGFRCLAPDLIGFGRSDKITERTYYTYARHLQWVTSWFNQMDVKNVTLFCQDWGGLLGLRMVAADKAAGTGRFARVCASNTFLPTGKGKPSDAFLNWRAFSQSVPEFPAAGIIKGATVLPLSEAVYDAYNAPYPEESYKAGARQFPLLVPASPDDPETENNEKAWVKLEQFTNPFLTLFGDSDPVTAGLDKELQNRIPGAKGQPHTTIKDSGHFIQEDQGAVLADHLIKWIRST